MSRQLLRRAWELELERRGARDRAVARSAVKNRRAFAQAFELPVKAAKPSKYKATRIYHAGRWFDSKAEAARFDALLTMGRAGLITDLELQPTFVLHAAGGAAAGRYVADFKYYDRAAGAWVVEDVKGMRTLPLARWKQKHLRLEYGVVVREIRR